MRQPPDVSLRTISTLAACALAGAVAAACSSRTDDDGLSFAPNQGAGGTLGAGGSVAAAGGSGGSTPGSGGSGGAPAAGGTGGAPAAGGTGGAPAAGGTGGAAGTGGSSAVIGDLCPQGSAFCEDFEDDTVGQVPSAPWSPSLNGATAVINTTRAFSGANALLVNAPTGAAYRRGYVALQQSSYAAAAQNMFGRVMVWLEAPPNGTVHWTLFQGEGRSATNNYNAIYRFGGQQQNGAGLMANYETTPDGNPPVRSDCYDHSASTMPVQQWACVEWHFVVATNEMQYWLNGSELADIHVINEGEGCLYDEPPLNGQWLAPPSFQTLYMGWEHYQQAPNDINVWLDGVVVSTTRVGCPAAP
jgi:hypothetical protein